MKSRTVTATIADTATESSVVNVWGAAQISFYIPAGFDGVSLKFKAAVAKAGTYLPVYDEGGNEVELVVAAGQVVAPSPLVNPTGGLPWLKLVTDAQAGAIDVTLIIKE
jgi:hypothetical protein